MNGMYTLTVGDRGRIVVPAKVREQAGLSQGDQVVLLQSSGALILFKREELLARVRADLGGLNLVSELLEERRQAAQQEDAG